MNHHLKRRGALALLAAAGLLFGACGSEADDELGPGQGSTEEAAEIETVSSALCVPDNVYRYRGYVAGYKTWSQNCTGTAYQTKCSSSFRRSRRDGKVYWDIDANAYRIQNMGAWRVTGDC